ncbi:MAG TPA: hypothetical protein VGM88_34945 [Kofleriaceae bacterium]|jgi:Arc/MetJ family transcription regulator
MSDDLLDPPETAAERAQAKAFAELIDNAIAGKPAAGVMDADARALLEVATVVRAAHGKVELPADRARAAVEGALRAAVGAPAAADELGARRAKRAKAPWIVAAVSSVVAVAALLLLWLRPAHQLGAPMPTAWRSRPADALVGKIEKAQAFDAASRIDEIYADRLEGYRQRQLAGGRP